MKQVELKCGCGASVTLTDSAGAYITNGGEADALGRKFIIEVMADRWMEQHPCTQRYGKQSEVQP